MLGMPSNVFAATIKIEDTNIYENEYKYYKMVNGILSSEVASSEEYNIKLDKEKNELYLNNFTTNKEISTDLEELNIILEGTNKVKNENDNAIFSLGNLIFSGTGSIEILGEANGIKVLRKITINDGTFLVNGTSYNGLEAFQIEINGGWIKALGGYSGIHTQPEFENLEEDYFHMNGGNLYAVSAKGSAINSQTSQYRDCIVLIEDNNQVTFHIYGTAKLLKSLTLSIDMIIPKDSVLMIPEGVELKLEDKNQLILNGPILLQGKCLLEKNNFITYM